MPNGKCYRYPVDYENLKKGDKFGQEFLERLFHHKAKTPDYNYCCLQLRSQIMTEMSKRGNPVTVAIRGMELHVLTDEEAVEYNNKEFHFGIGRMVRAHKRTADVDITQLQDESRQRWERNMLHQGIIVQSYRNAKKVIRMEAKKSLPAAVES